MVSLSFISFFIDHKSAAARAPLGVTSVLTITTMLEGKLEQKTTKTGLYYQKNRKKKFF